MAKRKGAATSSRKRTAARSVKARPAGRKQAVRKKSPAARRATTAAKRKPAKRQVSTTVASRPATGRKTATRKTAARKTATRKTATRTITTRKIAIRKKPVAHAQKRTLKASARKVARPVKAPPTRQRVSRREPPVTRKAPALNRNRRTISEEDMVPMPPSSLDLDRTASSARSGRRGLRERFDEHTETSPALTGGDVDADWESAYSVGDEAPGGDNPTPDQDIVDDIGRAVGVEYQDNEELKGDEKIADRDRHRWELDPASAED
jgi:hypothetical protein